MINFRTNTDNNDYIIIDAKFDLIALLLSEQDFLTVPIPDGLKNEINNMYFSLFEYEKEKKTGYISEISILKNSTLGKFLLSNTDMEEIINEDQVVDYKKVVNAFNIAAFQADAISAEIYPLFCGQIQGNKEELIEQYDEKVLDYILENPSFDIYLEKKNGTYKDVIYTVYEDGEYSQKKLSKNKNLSKIKK